MVCEQGLDSSPSQAGALRPVLMDFGLARDSLGPQRLTQTGVIMGTDQPFSTVRRGSLSGSVRYLVAEWMGWPRNRVMVYGLWDMDR